LFHKDKTTLDKKAPPYSSQLTVMIMRGVGTIRSFKLSYRFLFWASLFFILYIIASIILINKYFSEAHKNRLQSDQLQRLMKEAEEIEKELYRSNQHLAFLKDYINKIESGNDKELEPPEPSSDIDPGKTIETPQKIETIEAVEAVSQGNIVDINDFSFKQEGAELTVDFKLSNTVSSKEAVSGYVHIIAVKDDQESQRFWSSPKVAIREGIPVNYKQGQLFIIKYFKKIRGRYFFETANISPSSIKVLVYNRSGDLILEKVFETTKTS